MKYVLSTIILIITTGCTSGELGVDGHRADLVVLKTARAHAAFEGRTHLSDRDILLAAELALPHRLKRHPLEDVEVSLGDLSERLAEARAQNPGEAQQTVEEQNNTTVEATSSKKA